MKLTLNRLNKILKGLQGHKNPRWKATEDFSLALVTSDVEAFKTRVKAQLDKICRDQADAFDIANDYYKVKSLLFRANMESGISSLLSEKEVVTHMIKQIDYCLGALADDNLVNSLSEVTPELVETVKTASASNRFSTASLKFAILETSGLEKMLDNNRKRNTQIDDEILRLNATTQVEVELSEASIKLLGL